MESKTISTEKIKELRKLTGAGIMDCREVLEKAKGDIELAKSLLRQKGVEILREKEKRKTEEGLIDAYVHTNGKIGVLIEVNCETDFVAQNSEFKEFVHNLAMHIAASSPLYISRKDVPVEIKEKEKEKVKEELKSEGEIGKSIEEILDHKLEEFYKGVCLLEQPYIKNPDITVKDYLGEIVSKLGENIVIRRFVRYMLGEGS